MTVIEQIYAFGHENILGTHRTTIELTKENSLSKRGNCIIGVNSSKACVDLSQELKNLIKNKEIIKVSIKIGGLIDFFYGEGNENLTLLDNKDMVFRKSDFICDRTILINCTKSSRELNRDIVKNLKVNGNKFFLIFEKIDKDVK